MKTTSKQLTHLFRSVFSFSSMLVAVFMAAVYFFLSHKVILADPDIWWHLRNAELLIQHHSFIQSDLYSFTEQGKSWINPEWLAEIPYYLAWKWFGYRGLYIVTVGLLEGMLVGCCMLGWQRTKNVRPALLATCIFLLLATVSLGPRTQIFGWLCFIVEMAILWEFSDGRNYLWALPILFALWVNLHGSWPIGIVLLAVYAACRWRSICYGVFYSIAFSAMERGRVAWTALLSLLALFINPYGWHLVLYPFVITFQHHLTANVVEEWQSLNFHQLRGQLLFGSLAMLLCVSLIRKRRWQLHEVVFLSISVFAAFSYSRFLLLAGIVLVPLITRELNLFSNDDLARDKPILNMAIIFALMFYVATHIPANSSLEAQSEQGYPLGAVKYLQTVKDNKPILNDFNWGGYLLWNQRNIPVLIDSRTDIYEQDGVLADYLSATQLLQTQKVLDKYQIKRVLLPSHAPLAQVLELKPGWAIEYQDETAVVLTR